MKPIATLNFVNYNLILSNIHYFSTYIQQFATLYIQIFLYFSDIRKAKNGNNLIYFLIVIAEENQKMRITFQQLHAPMYLLYLCLATNTTHQGCPKFLASQFPNSTLQFSPKAECIPSFRSLSQHFTTSLEAQRCPPVAIFRGKQYKPTGFGGCNKTQTQGPETWFTFRF